MTDTATVTETQVTPPAHRWPCSWEGCPRSAVAAARFHGQAGHVHDCSQHIAMLREWSDVAEVVPLPCLWPHGNGASWIDQPRDLA